MRGCDYPNCEDYGNWHAPDGQWYCRTHAPSGSTEYVERTGGTPLCRFCRGPHQSEECPELGGYDQPKREETT